VEPILSKQEIADLLSTLQHRSPGAASGARISFEADASAYSEIDLFELHSSRYEPEKIPNFDIILELFGEYYSGTLTRFLPCSIEVTPTGIEYQRFNTYLVLESHPAAIGLIKTEPLKYGGLVTFSPQLAFTLLELMLGGVPDPDVQQPDRSATRIELSVLQALMERACSALQQALAPVVQIGAELVKMAHDRRLVSLVNADAELVVCTLHVHADQMSGSMQLVFPTRSFTPYREAFENLLHMDDFDAGGWFQPLSAAIDALPCTVMAETAAIDMTIRDLIDLKTGDVLMLPCKPGARIRLLVEGKQKFSGYQNIHNRKRYIHITKSIG
jgi:flagellar motor switch protein FliM